MLSITNHQGNANQNHNLTLIRMAITKKDKKWQVVGKDVKQNEPLYIVGGDVNWYNRYVKKYDTSPPN